MKSLAVASVSRIQRSMTRDARNPARDETERHGANKAPGKPQKTQSETVSPRGAFQRMARVNGTGERVADTRREKQL